MVAVCQITCKRLLREGSSALVCSPSAQNDSQSLNPCCFRALLETVLNLPSHPSRLRPHPPATREGQISDIQPLSITYHPTRQPSFLPRRREMVTVREITMLLAFSLTLVLTLIPFVACDPQVCTMQAHTPVIWPDLSVGVHSPPHMTLTCVLIGLAFPMPVGSSCAVS